MKSFLTTAALVVLLTASLRARESVDPDAPYGPITKSDVARLETFAKDRGYYLKEPLVKIYPLFPQSLRIDEKALGQLFRFSVSLTRWDQNARTYGYFVFCSLVYVSDEPGGYLDIYSKVLEQQSTLVRQRIRDIILYPNARLGRKTLRGAEGEYKRLFPKLFPADYRYGTNDSLEPEKGSGRAYVQKGD